MKLQFTPITTAIVACALADLALASPTSKEDSPVGSWGLHHHGLLRRGLSDWGHGHYGGTVSEITWAAAKEIERIQREEAEASGTSTTTDTASSTITAAPTTTETIAAEPTTTEELTIWSTFIVTETVTVTQSTSTVTAIATPTETAAPVKKAKREEWVISSERVQSGVGGADELDELVKELNSFFTMDAVALGDPCTPVTEFENKICIGNIVAICGGESWTWEIDLNCSIGGLICRAARAEDFVHGDWRADIQCLDE